MASGSMMRELQTNLMIDNVFSPSASSKTFRTFNPATEEKVADVAESSAADVDRAVAAARAAFDSGPWRRSFSPADRGRLLFRLAELVEANGEELAALESLENGKPFATAKTRDVALAAASLRYYAGWADKIHGKVLPVSGPFLSYTKREPVGVCAQVLPWNFPLVLAAWKLGAALACGNTVVLKPAEQTPLATLRLGELVVEAEFPKGVVNILPGFGPDAAGSYLTQHPGVDKIAFTGSTQVGYELMRASHVGNLKRVTLELGGKSATVVLDDADLDVAVEQAAAGAFANSGQSCVAGSRVFVQSGVYDEFLQRVVEATRAAGEGVGDPFDSSTCFGPLVDEGQLRKVLKYIDSGVQQGATLLVGGERVGEHGWFLSPAVLADVTDDMTIARQEIFGPVMCVLRFETVDEAIARANGTCYGLAAAVMTRSLDAAVKVSSALRAGTVYVNCYNAFDPAAPFGGFKDSGVGRELGEAGLDAYLESKTIMVKRPDDALP